MKCGELMNEMNMLLSIFGETYLLIFPVVPLVSQKSVLSGKIASNSVGQDILTLFTGGVMISHTTAVKPES